MPPRRQAPPKPESKAGLVIALVFFILATIGTGTAAYLGFDGQKELKVETDKAKADAKKANEDANAARAQLAANQYILGTEVIKEEDVKQLAAQPAFAAELRKIKEAMDTTGSGVTWDAQGGRPPESVVAILKKLKAERDNEATNAKNALAKADETNTNAQAKGASDEAAKKAALTASKNSKDELVVAQENAEKAKLFQSDKIADQGAQIKKLTGEKETEIATRDNKLKLLNVKLDDQNKILDKLDRDREAFRQKVLLKDKAHGMVTSVDGSTGMAYISLGSEDAVRPSLTFSILLPYDISDQRDDSPLPKKATLEVQQVISEHLSRATIKYADGVNEIKNPVEAKDLLYKPGWNKGQPIQLALIGHFDLNGQGADETQLLTQRYEKQGVRVQAYYDLGRLEWVGDFNHQVDYLVLGELPHAGTVRMLGEERAKLIERKIIEEIEKARNLRIMVVRAAQFLPASGIDLPRRPLPPVFPAGSGGPAAPKTEEKPKEKDEGK